MCHILLQFVRRGSGHKLKGRCCCRRTTIGMDIHHRLVLSVVEELSHLWFLNSLRIDLHIIFIFRYLSSTKFRVEIQKGKKEKPDHLVLSTDTQRPSPVVPSANNLGRLQDSGGDSGVWLERKTKNNAPFEASRSKGVVAEWLVVAFLQATNTSPFFY